ncbi:MAG: hypothetical protein POELPBGB_03671 [Bacteroidia bacterium]|nr:hypothetical protein [Bacteroidia bacterium]
MKAQNQFTIQFSGLKPGIHDFEFEIDKKFFESIEYSEIQDGKLHVALALNKHTNMLVLDFVIAGEVNVPCDRCGEDFLLPLTAKERLIVKFGDETAEVAEDVLVISRNESEINVAHFIYEYIILALPHKRVHPEGKCNKEVLKKLKKLEDETTKNKNTDPRWDGLKNIVLN